MKADIKIMAVKPRRKYVLKMLEKIGLSEEDTVIYDDRPTGGGTSYTWRKAWLAPMDDDVTHRVLLQDDLLICDNFIEIVNQMINVHPEVIFTLFCPRVRMEDALPDSPYVVIKGYNTWGQGNILPKEYIQEIIDFSDRELGRDFQWDDGQYAWWAREQSVPIMTTIPSTIQHLCPTQSTLGYNNKNKISKVWIGEDLSRVNWKSKAFTMSKPMPISTTLEYQKKIIAEKGNNVNPFTIFRDSEGNKFED